MKTLVGYVLPWLAKRDGIVTVWTRRLRRGEKAVVVVPLTEEEEKAGAMVVSVAVATDGDGHQKYREVVIRKDGEEWKVVE